jgi:hypothetical protein
MRYHGRQILPWTATPGVTGYSWSVLAEADHDDHRLDTLVNMRNKAKVWRGYLRCPCSRDPLAMDSYPDALKSIMVCAVQLEWGVCGAGRDLNGWLKKAAALRK